MKTSTPSSPWRKAFTLAAGVAVTAPETLHASVMTGLTVGSVSIAAPFLIAAGLAGSAAMWPLLKNILPKPKMAVLPSLGFLADQKNKRHQPERMPVWQKLMNVGIISLAGLGLSGIRLNQNGMLQGNGPVNLIVDNDWRAARNWPARQAQMEDIIARAEHAGRPVLLLATAHAPGGSPLKLSEPMNASDARRAMLELQPHPWEADHKGALQALNSLDVRDASSILLSDGQNDPELPALVSRLQHIGHLTVLHDSAEAGPHLLLPPDTKDSTLTVKVRRPAGGKPETLTLAAGDENDYTKKEIPIAFKSGETEAKGSFALPAEIQNEVAQISIKGENSAGAIALLDERWRRRPVGVVETGEQISLLSEAEYIETALKNVAIVSHGDAAKLVIENPAVIILPDAEKLSDTEHQQLKDWVNAGGTLLRFAGPNLASQPQDDLLPVPIEAGARTLNGGLSADPLGLLPFEAGSPFAGIEVPTDIKIWRMVMAKASGGAVWAQLEDHTSLITEAAHGKGQLVLVHTTATPAWSDLDLSQFFIDMLRTVVAQSKGVTGGADGATVPLPPLKIMNGLGRSAPLSPTIHPLTKDAVLGPSNPPGLYGNGTTTKAFNLSTAVPGFSALPKMPDGVTEDVYSAQKREHDLKGILLYGGFLLALVALSVRMRQEGALFSQGAIFPAASPKPQ